MKIGVLCYSSPDLNETRLSAFKVWVIFYIWPNGVIKLSKISQVIGLDLHQDDR
jgi:hypothetical protein